MTKTFLKELFTFVAVISFAILAAFTLIILGALL